MGAGLGLATAEDAGAPLFQAVPGGDDVVDFVADMMHSARRVALQEPGEGRIRAQRRDELDRRVGEGDEDHGDPVFRQVLGLRHPGAQGVAIDGARRLQVGHRDGHVIESADH